MLFVIEGELFSPSFCFILIFDVMPKWFDNLRNPKWLKWLTLGGSELIADAGQFIDGLVNYDDYKNNDVENRHQEVQNLANDYGVTLEELFNMYPELIDFYNGRDGDLIDKVTSKVEDFVDKTTGERDVQENEKNRQFQHDEAQIARWWEAEQAKTAREWDSIGAQMERAAAVGVNPVSIAMQNGGINSSATTSIPSSPGIPAGSSGLMHNGALDIASLVFQGIGTLAENRLKQTQSDDIVAMRQYNIAEKIANVDHLRTLDSQIELSNVAQSIQNRWLDILNQVTYDGMLLQNGVSRETIYEKRSIRQLNLAQVDNIRQSMELNLKEFNSKLPLELQLMETQIDLNKMSVQDIYSEICLRYLQSIEQENRNRQSAAEAGQAEVAEYIAKQTYEEQIASFHNNMLKSAADAGVSLYEYQYYGSNYSGFFDWMAKTQRAMFGNRKKRDRVTQDVGTRVIIPKNAPIGQK